MDRIHTLGTVSLFQHCGPEELVRVIDVMDVVAVPAGTTIFRAGDPAKEMYVIASGQVRITSDVEMEREVRAHLGPGQFFGEMALLTGEGRTAAVVTTHDCELYRLDRVTFERLLREQPALSVAVSEALAERSAPRERPSRALEGRTGIVTGASRGLGVHIARDLAERGMNLVLAARSVEQLAEVTREIEGLGVQAACVPTDVRDRTDLARLVETAETTFGSVDVLVNNAGIQRALTYHKLHADEIEELIDVNLTAPMLLTWMVVPGMLERGFGHVVHVSSLIALAAAAYAEPYAATKAGLVAFTNSFRATYRGTGVSSSVVCPGLIDTGIFAGAQKAGLSAPKLLGVSRPERVSRAILKAIDRDIGELIVNPTPMRAALVAQTMFPRFAERVRRRIGADSLFRSAARIRGGRRARDLV